MLKMQRGGLGAVHGTETCQQNSAGNNKHKHIMRL